MLALPLPSSKRAGTGAPRGRLRALSRRAKSDGGKAQASQLAPRAVPYLNARHSRLLNQEGDEDEAPQALSPGQRDDGVQVPAGVTGGARGV